MAHFAELDKNDVVLQVIVVNNNDINNLSFPESENVGVEFCRSIFGPDTIWKQTSYNGNFRKRYAGPGYTYDAVDDVFIAPKPFDNWILDETIYSWIPPVPKPTDDKQYQWNQEQNIWEEYIPNT